MKNQSAGVVFSISISYIEKKSGKGKTEDQTVGVALINFFVQIGAN